MCCTSQSAVFSSARSPISPVDGALAPAGAKNIGASENPLIFSGSEADSIVVPSQGGAVKSAARETTAPVATADAETPLYSFPQNAPITKAEDGVVFRKRRREGVSPLLRRDNDVSDEDDYDTEPAPGRPSISSLKRANPIYDSEEEEEDEIYFSSPAKRYRSSSTNYDYRVALPRQTFFLPQSTWGTSRARVLSDAENENRAYSSLCFSSSESEDEENE